MQVDSGGLDTGVPWTIAAPTSRSTPVCGTCLGEIPARTPPVRKGAAHTRVHHIGCVATTLGRLENLSGWIAMTDQAKTMAQHQWEARGVELQSQHELETPDIAVTQGPESEAQTQTGNSAEAGVIGLKNMNFWGNIPWSALHHRINTVKVVPETIRPAVADFRKALCEGAQSAADTATETMHIKALLFSDHIIFSTARRSRGGAREQRGETLARYPPAVANGMGRVMVSSVGRGQECRTESSRWGQICCSTDGVGCASH